MTMNDKKDKQAQSALDSDKTASDLSQTKQSASSGSEKNMKQGDQTTSRQADPSASKVEPSQNKDAVTTSVTSTPEKSKDNSRQATTKKNESRPSAPASTVRQEPPKVSPPPSTPQKPTRGGILGWLTGLVVIGLVGVAGLTWWQEQRLDEVSRLVASRLSSSDSEVTSLQQMMKSTQATVTSQEETVQVLRRDVRSLRSEVAGFDKAWQTMSRGLDDRIVINDVRRLLLMAQQQLALTGHIPNAISILEVAQSVLSHQPDSVAFADLHDAISRDLSELRVLPVINVNALSSGLKRVAAVIESAPLLMPDQQVPSVIEYVGSESPAQSPASDDAGTESSVAQSNEGAQEQAWWQSWADQTLALGARATQVLSKEFANLVEVRHASDSAALLLSDQQAMLLRTNLHSMLLTAQLAMLAQENTVWQSQLESVESIVTNYYDTKAPETLAALEEIKQLKASSVKPQTGSVSESLSALAMASQLLKTTTESGESQ